MTQTLEPLSLLKLLYMIAYVPILHPASWPSKARHLAVFLWNRTQGLERLVSWVAGLWMFLKLWAAAICLQAAVLEQAGSTPWMLLKEWVFLCGWKDITLPPCAHLCHLCRWSILNRDITLPWTLDSSRTWTLAPCPPDDKASSLKGTPLEKACGHPRTDRAETLLRFLLKGVLALAIGTAQAPVGPVLTTLGTRRPLPWAALCPAMASPSPL